MIIDDIVNRLANVAIFLIKIPYLDMALVLVYAVPMTELCPGSKALEGINARLR